MQDLRHHSLIVFRYLLLVIDKKIKEQIFLEKMLFDSNTNEITITNEQGTKKINELDRRLTRLEVKMQLKK